MPTLIPVPELRHVHSYFPWDSDGKMKGGNCHSRFIPLLHKRVSYHFYDLHITVYLSKLTEYVQVLPGNVNVQVILGCLSADAAGL